MLGFLHDVMARAKYISNKLTYLSWMNFFLKGQDRNAEFQLTGFFAYWLSYYVFPSPSNDGMNPFLFPMAVLLAQKKQVALGTVVSWLSVQSARRVWTPHCALGRAI